MALGQHLDLRRGGVNRSEGVEACAECSKAKAWAGPCGGSPRKLLVKAATPATARPRNRNPRLLGPLRNRQAQDT